VSDAALGILKGCLLALLYLFLLRVVLLVASELRGTPGLGRAAAPVPAAPMPRAAAKPSRRERRAARTPARSGWRLVVTAPESARGAAYPVAGELTIGRGGGCGIALAGDTYVSTVHARAFDRDGELWIEDLGSTNGTLLNDAPLHEPSRMRQGDHVTIGHTVLEASKA
jgi:hypothetical protein